MTLSDTVRLARSGVDPATTVTVDLPVGELVLLIALCDLAFVLSSGTRSTGQPAQPGSVAAPDGPHRTLDLVSVRLYLALRRVRERPRRVEPTPTTVASRAAR